MVHAGKLMYPDIVRLTRLVLKSKYSDKYKLDLVEGLTNLKNEVD